MKKHKLPINKIKQHYDFTPKNCPTQIRAGKNGVTWGKFVEMVKGGDTSTTKPASKPQSKPTNNKKANMTTNSIVV